MSSIFARISSHLIGTYFNGCEDSTFFLIEDKPHLKIAV